MNRHELAAPAKDLTRLLAHDQIDVALPQLELGSAMPCHFSGSGRSDFTSSRSSRDVDRQLAGLAS